MNQQKTNRHFHRQEGNPSKFFLSGEIKMYAEYSNEVSHNDRNFRNSFTDYKFAKKGEFFKRYKYINQLLQMQVKSFFTVTHCLFYRIEFTYGD